MLVRVYTLTANQLRVRAEIMRPRIMSHLQPDAASQVSSSWLDKEWVGEFMAKLKKCLLLPYIQITCHSQRKTDFRQYFT
jgi:hypothetical protein